MIMKNEYINTPSVGNLLNRHQVNDGHGGHSKEHHQEMEAIAEAKIREIVPEMIKETCNKLLENIDDAIQYDVETNVSVSVNSLEELFRGHKLQRIISDAIMKQVRKNIKNLLM